MEKRPARIIWTQAARADVRKIVKHLRKHSESNADKVVERIFIRTAALQQGFTRIGAREPLLMGLEIEFRYLIEGKYKIIYYPRNSDVVIAAVFDTRQNPVRLLSRFG